MSLRVIKKYIEAILSQHGVGSDVSTYTLKYDKDEAAILKGALHGFTLLNHKLYFAGYNFFEFFKSRIKRRQANYKAVSKLQFLPNSDLFINVNNGTAVVLHNSGVEKYFFKDVEYFRALYSEVADNIGVSFLNNKNHCSIKMEKYILAPLPMDDVTHQRQMQLINNKMFLLTNLMTEKLLFSVKYSPVRKIEQLFSFYNYNHTEYKERYSDLAINLVNSLETGRFSLCHGDLWQGNIMNDQRGRLKLIDYDKCLYFSSIYDSVYYYVMTFEKKGTWQFELKKLILRVVLFLTKIYREPIDMEEVRLCLNYMTLVKLTEFDLRSNKLGLSLRFLEGRILKNDV